MLFAHQGGEGEWPCNTLFALENSERLGADVLDVDVHLSKDGQLVLCHDPTLDRTTDATGPITERTAKELKNVDAGYRFTTDKGRTYPYRGRHLGIPTLEECFQRFPGKRFGVEIKPDDPRAVSELLRLTRAYSNPVLLSSFHDDLMREARKAGMATSATPGEVRVFLILSTLHLESLFSPPYEALQVPREHKGTRVLSPRLVEAAQARNVKVIPWTLNEPDEMQEAWALQVEGVNTDFPSRYLALRAKTPDNSENNKEGH